MGTKEEQQKFKEQIRSLGRLNELINERIDFPFQWNNYTPYFDVKWLTGEEASKLDYFDDEHIYFIDGDYDSSTTLHSKSFLVVIKGNVSAKNLIIENGSFYVNGKLTVLESILTIGDDEKKWIQDRNLLFVEKQIKLKNWFTTDFWSMIEGPVIAKKIVQFNTGDRDIEQLTICKESKAISSLNEFQDIFHHNLQLEEILSADLLDSYGYYDPEILIESLKQGKDVFANSRNRRNVQVEIEERLVKEKDLELQFKQRLQGMGELGKIFFSRSNFPCFHNGAVEVKTEWIIGGNPMELEYTHSDANYFIEGDLIHKGTLELDSFLTVVDGNVFAENLIINEGSLYITGNLVVNNVLYATSTPVDRNQDGNLLYVEKHTKVKKWINIRLEAYLKEGINASKIILDTEHKEEKYIPKVSGSLLTAIPELDALTTYDTDNDMIYSVDFLEQVEDEDNYLVNVDDIAAWLREKKNLFK